jgi:hypothetical protein
MAGEYGLVPETDLRGHFLTIRLARAEEGQNLKESSNGSSIVEKVRSLLRPRRESAVAQKTEVPDEERAPAEVQS